MIFTSVSQLPNAPAVYAMLGGKQNRYVAYIGISNNLRSRINQHLILRDSSITTGVSAVNLNADRITEVCWWLDSSFTDPQYREAAEIIAFDLLNPVLRSRGSITERANQIRKDNNFCDRMKILFSAEPAGRLIIPNLQDALEKIAEPEERIAKLEADK